MVQALLEAVTTRCSLHHVRLTYSEDMDSVGKFSFRKIGVLFATILQVWAARVRYGTRVLYYPPSGPNMVPVLRDIIFLCAVRPFFKWTVFHFHAGGVSEFEGRLPALLRPFFRSAYRHADLSIRTAPQNPEDGRRLLAKRDIVVPNGIADMRGTVPERKAAPGEPVVILFTGVLIPSKGVRTLLEAFKLVLAENSAVRLELMGRWGDRAFRTECEAYIRENGMVENVALLGVLQDERKWARFAACDIFCFPSHFEAESFGLVLVEAMQFAKPVVSTDWRGIPSVVEEGMNGFLVPVRTPEAVADRLLRLIADPGLRERMGAEGRRIFVERFTLERFQLNMEDAFVRTASAGRRKD